MTYDGYRLVFQIAGVVAIVMLIVSIILFIILKIPGVIGDLSGRTARKGIEDIRMQNMRSGDKRYKTSPVNHERGKLTDKITPSGNLIPGNKTVNTGIMTEKRDVSQNINIPDRLDNIEQDTMVLSQEFSGETVPLLNVENMNSQKSQNIGGMEERVVIESEIRFVHTNEIIL